MPQYKITDISNHPFQTFRISIPNQSKKAKFTLRYMPSIHSWELGFEYDTVSANSIRLNLSPNILRSFSTKIPFGLKVKTANPEDTLAPIDVEDISSGRIELYLLDEDYIEEQEGTIYIGY